MASVLGIDLSTRAVDIVALDESTNRAEWVHVELVGSGAWERTLSLPARMPGDSWYDERGVFLVAVEAPYGRGQAGTNALLNRVVGAVAASLPAHLRDPARCWLVAPHEWKAGLGLKGKPTQADMERLAPGGGYSVDMSVLAGGDDQNGRDAYCIALWARGELERGVQEAV